MYLLKDWISRKKPVFFQWSNEKLLNSWRFQTKMLLFGLSSLMKVFDLALQSKPVWMRLKVGRFSAEHCSVWKSNLCRVRHKLLCLTSKLWKCQYYLCKVRHKLLRTIIENHQKICHVSMADSILSNMVTERRRPWFWRFFDDSRKQIGKHSFKNRLLHLNDLTEPRLYPTVTF